VRFVVVYSFAFGPLSIASATIRRWTFPVAVLCFKKLASINHSPNSHHHHNEKKRKLTSASSP
jgi:hypothetical protein